MTDIPIGVSTHGPGAGPLTAPTPPDQPAHQHPGTRGDQRTTPVVTSGSLGT